MPDMTSGWETIGATLMDVLTVHWIQKTRRSGSLGKLSGSFLVAKYWTSRMIFSWDEMGKYDIPAIIETILKATNQSRLHYIGHSMGTTGFMAMANERPEIGEKVNNHI